MCGRARCAGCTCARSELMGCPLDLWPLDPRITLANNRWVRRRVRNVRIVDKSGGLYSHVTDSPPSRGVPTTDLETDCLMSTEQLLLLQDVSRYAGA